MLCPPPVATFANRHDLQLVQTVGVEEVIAVLLGLHQHPLVDVQSGIVNDIIRLDHFRLFDAGLHAGRLAVEVRIAVGIILQDQLRADADTEAVEGVRADLAGLVGALYHAVRLVIEISCNGDVPGPGGRGRADLFFLHQIAALIVGIAVVIDAGDLLLIAAHMLAHHLVEVVVLVGILFALGGTALLQQVAQRIVGVGIGEGIVGIDLQPAGAAGEPVQCIIGKGRAALEVFRGVAVPLELPSLVRSSFFHLSHAKLFRTFHKFSISNHIISCLPILNTIFNYR